ncbi:hypothetical protein THOB06_270004 [Vibrio rotiferianus]|nr:hypothetical protein THOB06_270004 [Vibrio rotiferianus]
MMLPAPKKNANSIKPTAIISVSFNVCFTDNPFSLIDECCVCIDHFFVYPKLMSTCGSIYKFPPHNDEVPIIWQPLRKKHHINLVKGLKSSGYHYPEIKS